MGFGDQPAGPGRSADGIILVRKQSKEDVMIRRLQVLSEKKGKKLEDRVCCCKKTAESETSVTSKS